MDWYKRKFLSTFIYALFGGVYGVAMTVGSSAIVFAKEKLTGGMMVWAGYFLICGIAILAGVVIILIERFLSVQTYNCLSVEEQTAICEKQAKYMDKGQRRRQVRRMGDNARTSAQLEKKNKSQNKKGNNKKGQADKAGTITTVTPTDKN